MGWHGSALTLGGAAGAPIVGFAVDHGGWERGFEVAGLVGLAMALAGLVLQAGRSRRVAEVTDSPDSVPEAELGTRTP